LLLFVAAVHFLDQPEVAVGIAEPGGVTWITRPPGRPVVVSTSRSKPACST
jgi:hypothetical protein